MRLLLRDCKPTELELELELELANTLPSRLVMTKAVTTVPTVATDARRNAAAVFIVSSSVFVLLCNVYNTRHVICTATYIVRTYLHIPWNGMYRYSMYM